VRASLQRKGITLRQVSRKANELYGSLSAYSVPHNLYHGLRSKTFTPSLPQVFALSQITGYGLLDWLRIFGFHPENIPRLQILLPAHRTLLLDTTLEDPEGWVCALQNRTGAPPFEGVAPLAMFLDAGPAVRLRSIRSGRRVTAVYARVGGMDAFAFPDIAPGSIVRANPNLITKALSTVKEERSQCLFLLEHANGVSCCRLRPAGKNRIRLTGTAFPLELQLDEEVRILGVVDLEIGADGTKGSPLQSSFPVIAVNGCNLRGTTLSQRSRARVLQRRRCEA
jgi:hypothetical protein